MSSSMHNHFANPLEPRSSGKVSVDNASSSPMKTKATEHENTEAAEHEKTSATENTDVTDQEEKTKAAEKENTAGPEQEKKTEATKRKIDSDEDYKRSMGKRKVPSPSADKIVVSEATKRKSVPDERVQSEATDDEDELTEEEKRYRLYLATTRRRKPVQSSGPIYPKYQVIRLKPSTPAEKIEAKMDPDKYYFGKSENLKKLSENLAAEAISYLRQTDSNWELVKACMYQGKAIARCDMLHVNFQAKRLNDPVETFFAQVRYGQRHALYEIDCCVSLGPSDSMPVRRDNHGCLYCTKFVHHPPGGYGGWSNGWPDWDPVGESKNK